VIFAIAVSLGFVAVSTLPFYYSIVVRRRKGERPGARHIAAIAAIDLLFFFGMVLWLIIRG
jgi:uncharacterized membrane protein YidH (DUF202 family)